MVLHGPLEFKGDGWEGLAVNLPSPVRGRRCPEGTDEGRFFVETSPCNSLSRWRERARERVGAFHLTPTGERPGAGGVFFSLNLCPLCGRHSAPLFSSRSRPMNGTVGRTRPGSSDLANATVTAREPTATEKPSAFLRSSKTAPATGGRDPAISGRRRNSGPWFDRWTGKNGDRSSFGG